MYLLYSALLAGYAALLLPVFLYSALRHGKYVRGLRERCGRLPSSLNPDRHASIWVHAVSVGEALAARPLVEGLRQMYPDLRLFVSTTTTTGQQVARERLEGADGMFFFPFDFGPIVRRVLDRLNPRLFVTVDTELWPNLLRLCRQRGIKTVVVNGRMSRRSHRRYRLAKPFFRRVLATVDRVCVQTEPGARRFADVGAPAGRVTVTGSLKFDAPEITRATAERSASDDVLRYFRWPKERPVLIAASTLRGEEEPVLRAFRGVLASSPAACLIIAPRHPERFGGAYRTAARWGFSVERRSALAAGRAPGSQVVILDTMGELACLYQIATVVFVGGSLVDAGGHNILEPAAFGKPIAFGPYMHNFAEIADLFLANGAACQVQSAGELERLLEALLGDPVERARLGAAARALVDANRGATARSLAAITELLPQSRRQEAVPAGRRRPPEAGC